MNLQQLEYVIAVDEARHFVRAAELCHVTQPTLSMMLHKLEEELEIKIFDRSKQPIEPTPEGQEIIKRARIITGEIKRLKEYTGEFKNEIAGEIKLAVIPTLAPYIIPLFIQELLEKYPKLRITIKELTTSQIIECLKSNQIDIGLLATPLHETAIREFPLFYEEFFAYTSAALSPKKEFILPGEIDANQLWLLEEGHCFRSQVMTFCNLRKKEMFSSHLNYEAGSIETLINLVDRSSGITIIPHLAIQKLSEKQKEKIISFSEPKPFREISLVVNLNFARERILNVLKNEILKNLPIDRNLKKSKSEINPI